MPLLWNQTRHLFGVLHRRKRKQRGLPVSEQPALHVSNSTSEQEMSKYFYKKEVTLGLRLLLFAEEPSCIKFYPT